MITTFGRIFLKCFEGQTGILKGLSIPYKIIFIKDNFTVILELDSGINDYFFCQTGPEIKNFFNIKDNIKLHNSACYYFTTIDADIFTTPSSIKVYNYANRD